MLPMKKGAGNFLVCPRSHHFCMVLFLWMIVCFPTIVFGQATVEPVELTVRDAKTGEALPNASVKLLRTGKTSVTNEQGKLKLTLQVGEELEVSSLGYEILRTKLRADQMKQGKWGILLTRLDAKMDEVVVVGYGTVNRKDLTGSVSSVNVEDLQKAPVRNFEEALAGRVPGVQVTSSDGQPGSPINIVIRGANSITGSNSPLYVIDGFPIEDPENNAINPEDIATIDILKDASATAIYGARAANGVILITTKSGKDGPSTISYNGYAGVQQILQRMDLFTPYEFVKYQLERSPGSGTAQYINSKMPDLEAYRNVKGVDWQEELFRDAIQHSHTLTFQGGNKQTKYFLSGNIFNQQGVLISSGYNRAQGRLRVDHQVNKNLKLNANINYSGLKQTGSSPIPPSGTALQSAALMYSVWGYRPITGNPDDNLLDEGIDEEIDLINDYRFNPVLNYQNQLRENESNVFSANGFLEYTFGDFRLRMSGGTTRQIRRSDAFDNSNTRNGNPRTPTGATRGVNGSVGYSEVNSYLNENTLSWDRAWGKEHRLSVVTGFTMQGYRSNSFGATAYMVPNESLGMSGLDEGIPNSIRSTRSRNTLASFLGRLNYQWKQRYLFTASFRADGSSKFSPQNRWGYFPSGAFSWRFSKEKFMRNLTFISDAKLRTSAGVTGNNRVSDFAYLSSLMATNAGVYPFGGAIVRGIVPDELGNPDLLWENTFQMDIGLDLSLFKDRLQFTADYYRKRTYDLLLYANLPASMGFSRSFKNIGEVENSGIELNLQGTVLQRKKFSWDASFNISFNRNKIVALAENQDNLLSRIAWNGNYANLPSYIAKVGYPIGMFYGLIWEGNYQYTDFDQVGSTWVLKPEVPTNGNTRQNIQPGDVKYRDLNGDGVANLSDYTIIGNPTPDFIGGFTNNFRWKNFDLNIFFQYAVGGDVYNTNRLVMEGWGGGNQNMFASYLNRWTPENQNNVYYRTGGWGPYAYSNRVLEDGSFLRLKTVSLGYNLPAAALKSAGIKSTRLYVSAQNIFTWHRYSGYDPEVSAYHSALTPGFDWSVYPRARTITVGLNMSF